MFSGFKNLMGISSKILQHCPGDKRIRDSEPPMRYIICSCYFIFLLHYIFCCFFSINVQTDRPELHSMAFDKVPHSLPVIQQVLDTSPFVLILGQVYWS